MWCPGGTSTNGDPSAAARPIYARAYPDRVLGPDTDGNTTPDPITDVVRVFQLGEAGMAQQSDGTLLQWGWRQCQGTQPISSATSVATVEPALTAALPGLVQATGNGNTGGTAIFRLADGSVFACGLRPASFVFSDNNLYPLESPTISFGPANPAVDVDTRPNDFWVVTADGKVWVRSFDPMVNSVPGCTPATCPSNVLHEVPVPPGAPVVDVEADSGEVHLRRSDGTLVTFGVNTNAATGHPEPDNSTAAEVPSPLAIDGFVLGSSPSGWNGLALVVPQATIEASGWLPPQTDVAVSAVGASGPEGGSATARVTLSRPVTADVSIAWRFDGRTGTAVVPVGLTSIDVPLVLPPRDGVWGVDRQLAFELVGVSAGAALADEVANVTVTDADPVPTLTVTPAVLAEGNGALTGHQMVLTMSGPAGVDLRFAVQSSDGTARAGTDYKTVSVDALMPAGTTSATAPIVLLGNAVPQPDRTLSLSATAVGVPISGATTLTIDDDDPASYSARSARTTPGVPARITLTVPMIPEGESVSIDWETTDGTATAGTDFDAATGRVVITGGPNGTGTGTITINTRPALLTAGMLVEETPSQVEALGLTVTLDATSASRPVLGPSQVLVAIERTTGAQPPPTTVPPTTDPPATVPPATVPAPAIPIPATPVGATPPPPAPVLTPSNVQLPATGGSPSDILVFAFGMLVLGLILRSQRRRTVT